VELEKNGRAPQPSAAVVHRTIGMALAAYVAVGGDNGAATGARHVGERIALNPQPERVPRHRQAEILAPGEFRQPLHAFEIPFASGLRAGSRNHCGHCDGRQEWNLLFHGRPPLATEPFTERSAQLHGAIFDTTLKFMNCQ